MQLILEEQDVLIVVKLLDVHSYRCAQALSFLLDSVSCTTDHSVLSEYAYAAGWPMHILICNWLIHGSRRLGSAYRC